MAKQKKDRAGLNSPMIRRPIQRWAPLFILPTFASFCIGFIWPFLQGIYLSFCKFNVPKDAQWVGFENYAKVFKDPGFANAFWNTAAFAVVSVKRLLFGCLQNKRCIYPWAYASTAVLFTKGIAFTPYIRPSWGTAPQR